MGSHHHAVKFIHTGDWQLGMTRAFLDDEAQARLAQARFDALRRIGRLALESGAEWIVACGDVFETHRIDRRTIWRALDALAEVTVPVYLVPGNHDPLEPGCVFDAPSFLERCPPHVHVLRGSEPVTIRPGVELVGVPWPGKRPLEDLVARALEGLPPKGGTLRIMAAHGAVDAHMPLRREPACIDLEQVRAALVDRIDYLALGDRHSYTRVDDRVYYAGSPEPTRFDEEAPGHALVVEVARDRVRVEPHRVGSWELRRLSFSLHGASDVERLGAMLDARTSKECTVVELVLEGGLTLREHARLEAVLASRRELLGGLRVSPSRSRLRVRAHESDFESLPLEGFGRRALERLRALERGESAPVPAGLDAEAATPEAARDALELLVRLAGAPA